MNRVIISSKNRNYLKWPNPFYFECSNNEDSIKIADSIISDGTYNKIPIILKWKNLNFEATVNVLENLNNGIIIKFSKQTLIYPEFLQLNYFKNFNLDDNKIIYSNYIGDDCFFIKLKTPSIIKIDKSKIYYKSFINKKNTSLIFIPLFFKEIVNFKNIILYNEDLRKGSLINCFEDNYAIIENFPNDWMVSSQYSLRNSFPLTYAKVLDSSNSFIEISKDTDYIEQGCYIYNNLNFKLVMINSIEFKSDKTIIHHGYLKNPFVKDEELEILREKLSSCNKLITDLSLQKEKHFYVYNFEIYIPNLKLNKGNYVKDLKQIFLCIHNYNFLQNKHVWNNKNINQQIELNQYKIQSYNDLIIFKSLPNVYFLIDDIKTFCFKFSDFEGNTLNFLLNESLDGLDSSNSLNINISFDLKKVDKI